MSTNGFRGAHLPPSPRVTKFEPVTQDGITSAGSAGSGTSGPTNDSVLAEYLGTFGPRELNLVVLNKGGRSTTDHALAEILDLMDAAVLWTTHGREPSTFNKELMPGVFMAPTPVQEAVGEWGIQGAVDAMEEGLDTFGPDPLKPPEGDQLSPMMWLITSGDPDLGERLYGAMDRVYRPHRHMWSHVETDAEMLHWLILVQLPDEDLDRIFPNLRDQPGWHTYLKRSDRYVDRLTSQTGTQA